MGGPSSQQIPQRLPLPSWPILTLEVPSLMLPATPMLPTLTLTEFPELWSVMLTEPLCQSTLLRFTLPRLPTLLPEVPSTLSEPTLPTTLTPTLAWWVTLTELSSQWSPLMSRLPELSILPPTPVLKRTN